MNPDSVERPLFVYDNLYNDTSKTPSGEIVDTMSSKMMHSSVFTEPMDMSTMTVPNPMIQGVQSLTDFYNIELPTPVSPPTPENQTWLK